MLHPKLNSRWPGAMWLLGCLLFLSTLRCEAQNLVPNPSFEQIDSCPQYPTYLGFQDSSTPLYWSKRVNTPDYFNACEGSSDTLPGIPFNLFGYQYAQDGNAYAGMFSYLIDDFREMIGVELTETMIVGQTYYGSFWVNPAYGGPQQVGYGSNKFGMLLTTSEMAYVGYLQTLALPNHAQVFSSPVISDTANWTLVSGSFVADSAYHYLVLGNHFENDQTTVEVIGPGNDQAYILVDAVCLSSNPLGCPLATSSIEGIDDNVFVGPVPAQNELRISWSVSGHTRLFVLDAIGRLQTEVNVLNRREFVLQVNGWADGVYHLILEGTFGRQTKQFLVMH